MPIPLRVLILEDQVADTELILHELRQAGFDPEWQRVETEEEYLAALHPALDIILSDYSLPQFDGLSAVHLLRARDLDIPFILVSGTIGEDIAVSSMKEGADDYLLKDRLMRLGPAVKSALERKRLRDERKLAEAALWETESQLRTVLNNAPITIFTTDSHGIFTLSAGKGLENVRLKPGENVGVSAFDLYSSLPFVEYSGKVMTGENVIRRVLAGEEVAAISELRGVYFDNHIGPLRGTDGKVVGIVGVAIDITERKQAEEALRNAEARYRILFEQSPNGVLLIDLETGKTIEANETAYEQLGYTREEFAALRISDYEASEKPEETAKHMQKIIREGNDDFETLHRTKSGEVRNMRVLAKIVQLSDRSFFHAIFQDITERKQAEEALRRNEALLLQTSKMAKVGGWELDFPRMKLLWSPETYRIHEADLSFQPDLENAINFYAPEARPIVNEAVRRASEEGTPYDLELPFITAKGRYIWVRAIGQAEFRDGKCVRLFGAFQDITERKQMEMSLAESEKNYRTLFENMPVGLYRTTSDGRMVDANPALVKMFGLQDRKALLAMKADDLYADPADNTKFLQAIRQGDIVSNFETKMQRQDGTTFWASDNVRINRDDKDNVLTYDGSMVDVTERKQAEKRNETQLRRLAALHSIDIAIASSFDLRVTLNVVTKQALDQLGVEAASVLLLDPYMQTLHYAAGNGFLTRAIETAGTRLGEGFAGRAALERQIIQVIDPVQAQGNPRLASFWTSEGFSAYCTVPIVTKGKVKGVLEVFHRAPHALKSNDDEWLNFLETLAGQTAIAIDNSQLFDGMQRANMDLAVAYNATIEGWSQAMDLRDKETEGHTQRVTEMAVQLAQAMGISDTEIVHIRRGALLHDIGKMGVPDRILLKPDKLTDEEWVLMKKHPQFAYDMLSSIAYLKPALDIPYCHHEKWDGTGYPRGLKGGQIPLAARLFAVVDVWDALRSDRPYRAAWTKEKTLAYIRELSGTHFDPSIVDVFLATIATAPKKESK